MKILATVVLALFAFPTQSITVGMDGAPPGLLVPGAIAVIRGIDWVTADGAASGSFGDDEELAGYSVRIGGRVCRLNYVSSDVLAFIVANDVEAGTRTLQVAGPAGGYSINVDVVQYRPRLVQQLVTGDPNSDCCVVATSSRYLYPELFLGQPIPVSPLTFNYISVHAVGLPTDRSTSLTVVLEGCERHELSATAHPFVGLNGVASVFFFAPSCADGDYRAGLCLEGQCSPPVLIRFVSSCAPITIEQPVRIARPRGVR
jgi:hypothetical protein